MAGSISLSLSQQFNSLGRPLAGGFLYFYAAGTVATPQNAYQDSALTIPHPNPLELDSAGRVPQLYFADGSIKIYLTDANGVPQVSADNILVIGASSGGGGGSSVDPTTILQTGWIQPVYGTGTIAGFVRANGKTLGNASSGATERANADTLALFTFLYNADANLSVSGGRGASAAVDYAANKTIALPDGRGLVLAGLDDMGNSARGVFTGVTFSIGSATTLGGVAGASRHTLTASELPANIPNSASTVITGGTTAGTSSTGNGGTGNGLTLPVGASTVTATTTVTINPGGGQAHDTMSPTMLVTYYIKL